MKKSIGIIGLGNMGSSLLFGLLKSEHSHFEKYFLYDVFPKKTERFQEWEKVKSCEKIDQLIENSNYILLAVKPKHMEQLLINIKRNEIKDKIFITIAAGLKRKFYKEILGNEIKISRIMPNTPYLVGEGAAGICFDDNLNEEDKEMILEIFNKRGKTIICEEKYLDVVTGLSGSGPAYIFLIIESLADGAVKMGLNRDDAYTLSAQTVLGSAKMVLETGKHPGELKDMVTSPGGTTIEAIRVLEKKGIRSALIEAVIAATDKSRSF